MNETRCYCDRCGVRIQDKFAHQVYLGADSSSSANEASAVDLCNSCFDSLKKWYAEKKNETKEVIAFVVAFPGLSAKSHIVFRCPHCKEEILMTCVTPEKEVWNCHNCNERFITLTPKELEGMIHQRIKLEGE